MGKKIVNFAGILQIILSIVAYFSMSYHFDNDKQIFALLANTDFIATMLRLSLYIIPGIHLLSGLYGLIFTNKKILFTICAFEMIASGLSFTFIGKSEYMFILSIVSCSIALIYLIGIIAIRKIKRP
mgnify:CR=1 FL=1